MQLRLLLGAAASVAVALGGAAALADVALADAALEGGTLAIDDECTAGGPDSCALSALQLRAGRAATAQASEAEAKAGRTSGSSAQDKPRPKKLTSSRQSVPVMCGQNLTCPDKLTCVQPYGPLDTKDAQCIDCSDDDKWQEECGDYSEELRLEAAKACRRQCRSARQVCREEEGDTEWCQAPYKCAVPAQGEWGKCILCTAKYFRDYCYGWLEPFASAAKELCHMDCHGRRLTHHRRIEDE